MSKEKILKYCDAMKNVDLDHVEKARDNAVLIREGSYRALNDCPENFGLDGHEGLCEIKAETRLSMSRQMDQCELCWKQVLGVKATAENVDDLLDYWHMSKGDGPVHEFLNWTEEEYLHYVMTGEAPKEGNE